MSTRTPTSRSDTVIVGGGIIGLTTAIELRRRGHTVTLLEKGRLGDGASGAAAGILSPLQPWRCDAATTALYHLSLSCYAALFEQLRAEATSKVAVAGETTSGLLCLTADAKQDRDAVGVHGNAAWECLELDAVALLQQEPVLHLQDRPGGILFPRMQQVEPMVLLAALVQQARRQGVWLREGCAVECVEFRQDKAVAVRTGSEQLPAEIVILCAGTWLAEILPTPAQNPRSGSDIFIRPVRGQMIEYAAKPGLLRHVVSDEVAGLDRDTAALIGRVGYLVPRPDGRILVGSTLEDCGFDPSTTPAARRALIRFAERRLPALVQYPIARQWAGLRPAPSRATPFIGVHPEIGNLWINAGHHRSGIALAPASAYLLAQMICGEETAVDTQAFAVGR